MHARGGYKVKPSSIECIHLLRKSLTCNRSKPFYLQPFEQIIWLYEAFSDDFATEGVTATPMDRFLIFQRQKKRYSSDYQSYYRCFSRKCTESSWELSAQTHFWNPVPKRCFSAALRLFSASFWQGMILSWNFKARINFFRIFHIYLCKYFPWIERNYPQKMLHKKATHFMKKVPHFSTILSGDNETSKSYCHFRIGWYKTFNLNPMFKKKM